MAQIGVKFLSKEDVASLMDLDAVTTITEEVFNHYGRGEIYSPPKESLPLQDVARPGMHWINSMPAYLKYQNVVGLKWVNVTSENIRRGLPVTMGVIVLNDADTGMPIAIVDGTWITHMRTGSSTAIGARLFARKDSKVITVVGCGAEGGTNLEATARFFDFDEIRLVDINPKAVRHFRDRLSPELNDKVAVFQTVEEAVKESDIILLTTTAQTPLMRVDWAKPGDYISTISCFADLDPGFIKAADKLYMDDKVCTVKRIQMMAGIDCQQSDVFGDICEVLTGQVPGRENDTEIIVYTPAGMGAVDVGIAYEALKRANVSNQGQDIVLAKHV